MNIMYECDYVWACNLVYVNIGNRIKYWIDELGNNELKWLYNDEYLMMRMWCVIVELVNDMWRRIV